MEIRRISSFVTFRSRNQEKLSLDNPRVLGRKTRLYTTKHCQNFEYQRNYFWFVARFDLIFTTIHRVGHRLARTAFSLTSGVKSLENVSFTKQEESTVFQYSTRSLYFFSASKSILAPGNNRCYLPLGKFLTGLSFEKVNINFLLRGNSFAASLPELW